MVESNRDAQTLIDDGILEDQARSKTSVAVHNFERRSAFVIEVLSALPAEDYQIIKEKKVWFFCPNTNVNGWNGFIPGNKLQMVYLPPSIETGWNKEIERRAIVAHEIAHVVLEHTGLSSTKEIEDAAWHKVEQWGFAKASHIAEIRKKLGGW